MTGAMRDALELIRSLKKQYPDETEDQLVSRFQKELEADRALKRAVMREVFNDLLQELDKGATELMAPRHLPRNSPCCVETRFIEGRAASRSASTGGISRRRKRDSDVCGAQDAVERTR